MRPDQALALAIVAVAVAACATRHAATRDESSPASPTAAEAPPHRVGLMLQEDPPLPGDDRADWRRWPGLVRDPPASGHQHHQHGHGPQAPEPSPGPDPAAEPRPPGGHHAH